MSAKESPPPPARRKNVRWKNSLAEEFLLDWMEIPGNWESYKGTMTVKNGRSRRGTSAKTKDAVVKEIHRFLIDSGINGDDVTVTSVRNKLCDMENTWKEANVMLKQTGEGLDDRDAIVESLKDKVLQKCPLWERLDPLFRDRPGMLPPFTGDNMDTSGDVQRNLLGCAEESKDEEGIDTDTAGGNESGGSLSGPDSEDDYISKNGELSEHKSTYGSAKTKHQRSASKTSTAKNAKSRGSGKVEMNDQRKRHDAAKLRLQEKKMELKHEQTIQKLQLQHEESKQVNEIRAMEVKNQRLMLLLEYRKAGLELPEGF
ncbi:hypothetical protein BV898_03051 [Hypsibius exemplaris]|uniref:Uncharacterized protein n=1 Tax=Hypsibius exemplaris TaxID=2072580 RepID=A0A1W0X6L0_HYPEX|nr:hypothetical protein BV898_03051 [Hypsibius exemplaris]